MTYPPRPNNISIPAVVAGNVLQNDDTSVSVIDNGYDGSIILKTQNKIAVLVNPSQSVSINTDYVEAMLTVNNESSTKATLRLSYMDSYYFDGLITSNGNVLFTPRCDDILLNANLITAFKKNFDIADHDGMNIGLRLNGRLVTATATELNYVDVAIGVAAPQKALVTNSNRDIVNINRLDANQLSGTLLTGPQPNITSLSTINITGDLLLKGNILDVDPDTMRYLKVISEGVAYASKAVILDSNKDFAGINHLSATTLTGTLSVGPQPNITSLSSLTSLTNNGVSNFNNSVVIKTAGSDQLRLHYSTPIYSSINTNILGDMIFKSTSNNIKTGPSCDFYIPNHDGSNHGLYLGSTLVTATADQLNYTNVTPGVASADKAIVLNADKNISGIAQLSATSLFGTINTASQPLITSVSRLNITSHNGTTGLSLNGVLVTASAAQLNYLDVVAGTTAQNKAVVVDSSNNIGGLNTISANNLSGVLTTSNQPNLSTVRTLTISEHNGATGLTLGSTLITATGSELNRVAVSAGSGVANKALILDGAKNIVGINHVSSNIITGTLQTGIQPNINSVNILNIASHNGSVGLSLGGVLVSASALQLNRVDVTAGVAALNKALVLNSSLSVSGINVLSASYLGGVLTSSTQPNIRNLTSIDIVDHNGTTSGLSLEGVLVLSKAYQLNYVSVQQGLGTASKAVVLDSTRSISNINNLSATSLTGTVLTSNQPNINRVSTLNISEHNGSTTGLALGGVLVTTTADQLNTLQSTAGIASAGKAIILNESKNITGINALTATSINGTLLTSNQPNISSVNVLNIASHNGTTTGLSLGGFLVTATAAQINRLTITAGLAAANKVLSTDALLNVSGINTLTADRIVGEIQTSSQPNITSVDTIDITGHNGGSDGLRLGGTLVSATAAQLNYNSVIAGTATAVRSLVTDVYNSIRGINTLSATKIISEELSLTGVISNFNTGGVVIKSYSTMEFVGRIIDVRLLETLTFSNFQPGDMVNGYSSEIIGYVLPRYSEIYTFYVTCTDKVRLWVNGELLLHSWASTNGARISSMTFLNADQWVPIYIQYQVNTGNSPSFSLEWSSNSETRGAIPTSRIAWDNNAPSATSKHFTQNSLTIYNTSTTSANTAKLSVDTNGDLIIDASGNDIALGTDDDFNIPSHNGISKGLQLGGVLVLPTAYELNYLKVSPGVASASHAVVIDGSKSITGLNSITATTLACDNLSTNAFTISNLSLSGPLNNYNTGSLLIRQITGPDAGGRVVDVNTITNIDFNNYDPKSLNTYFSLDISGYVLPTFTESYRFYATANDRVRIWVNNKLILNVWDTNTGTEHTSQPISLIAGQWVAIYIQFQNITGSSSLQVKWSSTTLIKSFISNAYMAWDNSSINPRRTVNSPNSINIYSASSGLTEVKSGSVAVDGSGVLSLISDGGAVSIPANTNFNIVGHNGTYGLKLAGQLVTSTAAELNYLSGLSVGSVSALKIMIPDADKSLTGFNVLSANQITGVITTANQPNITSIGTLSSTLSTTSDIVFSATNLMRIKADTDACYIQAGSSTTTNSACDLFIGNYSTTISASTRKFMLKSNGFVGIQTSSPAKTLSVNGAGETYCMRLIRDQANGGESIYCDVGVDASNNFRVGSNIVIGNIATATIAVDNSGIMKLSSSGGSLQIGNTLNSALPLEVGSTAFTISTATGYLNSFGSSGTFIPEETHFSMRTSSSIIVNGTVCVISDRRLKKNISTISTSRCKDFIMNSNPVQFTYLNNAISTHFGLVAQDIVKSEFSELAKLSPCAGVKRTTDADGFVSPEDAAFTISYEEIVPILMIVLKETITENVALKAQIEDISSQLKALTDLVHTFVNI